MSNSKTHVWDINDPSAVAKCPFLGDPDQIIAGNGTTNRDWWPNELKLNILRQNASKSDPRGDDVNYAEAGNSID